MRDVVQVPQHAVLYDAHGHDREVELTDALVRGLKDDQLLWIDIDASLAEELAFLEGVLDISSHAIERVIDLERDPYLDNYPNYFGFALDAPDDHDGERARGTQLGFLVGQRWLLTCHNRPVEYLTAFKAQDKGETKIGALSPALLAVSLLDWHLTQYFAEVGSIEDAVDQLDEMILADGTKREVLDRLVSIRLRVSRLRAQLATQRPIFYGFSRPDFALNFDTSTTAAYAAISARYDRAIDEVERSREVVAGSFELFTSMTTQQTNDLVKVLTFVTAIIGFCAAIAGLLGMNFELPFFKTGMQGFALISGGLLLMALISLGLAKWRRWL